MDGNILKIGRLLFADNCHEHATAVVEPLMALIAAGSFLHATTQRIVMLEQGRHLHGEFVFEFLYNDAIGDQLCDRFLR
jgi:hypothetical protein